MSAGAEVYEVGNTVGIEARFGPPEDPRDPRRVSVQIRDPQGRSAQLTYGMDEAVLRAGPGHYQVVIEAGVAGRWQYRFVGIDPPGELNGFFDVFDLAPDL